MSHVGSASFVVGGWKAELALSWHYTYPYINPRFTLHYLLINVQMTVRVPLILAVLRLAAVKN